MADTFPGDPSVDAAGALATDPDELAAETHGGVPDLLSDAAPGAGLPVGQDPTAVPDDQSLAGGENAQTGGLGFGPA